MKLEKLALLFCDMKIKIFLILHHKNNVELEIYLHIIRFIRKRAWTIQQLLNGVFDSGYLKSDSSDKAHSSHPQVEMQYLF